RAVESGFSTQIATQLDAGVAAGDVVETRPVQRADPDVLDRFRLEGKISRLRHAPDPKTDEKAKGSLDDRSHQYFPKQRRKLSLAAAIRVAPLRLPSPVSRDGRLHPFGSTIRIP